MIYPQVYYHNYWKSLLSIGNSSTTEPSSIAMLVYQGVLTHSFWSSNIWKKSRPSHLGNVGGSPLASIDVFSVDGWVRYSPLHVGIRFSCLAWDLWSGDGFCDFAKTLARYQVESIWGWTSEPNPCSYQYPHGKIWGSHRSVGPFQSIYSSLHIMSYPDVHIPQRLGTISNCWVLVLFFFDFLEHFTNIIYI